MGNKKYFKDICIGEHFGCWGDICSNHNSQVWMICRKDSNDSGVELNQDGSDGQVFLMNEHDEVATYSDSEILELFKKSLH